jgi:hypothetical protein
LLSASVLVVSFAAFMDAMLWTALNQPLRARQEAAQIYEIETLRAELDALSAEATQQRERADILSSALLTCTAETDATGNKVNLTTACRNGGEELGSYVGGHVRLCTKPASPVSP